MDDEFIDNFKQMLVGPLLEQQRYKAESDAWDSYVRELMASTSFDGSDDEKVVKRVVHVADLLLEERTKRFAV